MSAISLVAVAPSGTVKECPTSNTSGTRTNHERNEPAAIIAEYLQSDNVPESKNHRRHIDLCHHLHFVCQHFTVVNHPRRNDFGPPSECAESEIENAADQSAHNQHRCLRSPFFTARQEFPSSPSLSGKGSIPCMSFTKYFLKGIMKRIPR